MTFTQLTKLEPRLANLLRDVRKVRDDRRRISFCANAVWYGPGGFKSQLSRLVGWSAVDERLKSSELYDLAYEHLYNALPDCRNCFCGMR